MRTRAGTPTAVVAVVAGGSEVVVGRVEARRSDLQLLDRLLRMHLLARRRGWSVCLRDASDELRALVELAGLSEVLVLEPRRQPELREELRIEEVVQRGDPLP